MKSKITIFIVIIFSFFCCNFVGAVTEVNGVKIKDTQCIINSNGGNFFLATNVGIYCGSGVTSATWQWDKGRAFDFYNWTVVTYMADKKKQLIVNYKYNVKSGNKTIEKKGSAIRTFSTDQNTCTILPKGGAYDYSTMIAVRCGKNIKQASWQWDKDLPTEFKKSTYVQFMADKPRKLTVSFTYEQVSGQTKKDITKNLTQSYSIKKCYDSDGGINYEQSGSLEYARNGAIKVYNDICFGGTLTEYYCDSGSLKTQKAKCPRGCAYGACNP